MDDIYSIVAKMDDLKMTTEYDKMTRTLTDKINYYHQEYARMQNRRKDIYSNRKSPQWEQSSAMSAENVSHYAYENSVREYQAHINSSNPDTFDLQHSIRKLGL
jgi:hypothetical protein